MNLIEDAWIPVIRQDGTRCTIRPDQIAETDNPVMELAAPRADFQGALYQFLIGLLQTAFAPEDHDDWLRYWEAPPAPADLQERFQAFRPAFGLNNDSAPAFMQDYDLPEGECKPVEALLIDAPGAKTRRDNLAHFVKGLPDGGFCPGCAATALFTLQINAPSGGQGHRVGLRGGGPLTTLVIPEEDDVLWRKCWLNVLESESLDVTDAPCDSSVFPWLGPTRVSDKGGKPTLPGDASPLQMYWAMPRRIRLEFMTAEDAECAVCGKASSQIVSRFRTKNFGINYEGPWVHPLTPYRFDPDHKNPPLSLKGQPGGIGYRQWLGLTLQDTSTGDQAALVVQRFNDERAVDVSPSSLARLWCFGYDMDNMKARCWYESLIPVIRVPEDKRERFVDRVAVLIDAARDAADLLRNSVKAAWFKRPKEVKGDMSVIPLSFWAQTEADFYRCLGMLANDLDVPGVMPAEPAIFWYRTVCKTAVNIFDHWSLEGDDDEVDMKRVIRSRNELKTKLRSSKHLKVLRAFTAKDGEAA
ncbi:type I-E CRISPR-associated protein Cse1/CasA [Hahella sp. SMD15-11]|uniref:Type I-E CRISPR-associated protein Cse1/CasA n=1 Tax=Thermohahella caldifontis TaxID=3142973 RepID=A0AB39UTZ9_9GAMM